MISSYGDDDNGNNCDHDGENIYIGINQEATQIFQKSQTWKRQKVGTKQVLHSQYANIGRRFTKFNSPDARDL
jgi:hypothetical protein